jgi:branched-chain amino acid transport system ATP-binding protein
MSGAESILNLDDIHLRFGGITALNGVSIALATGRIHGVIGPNGAGKSSLLDVMSGMTPPSEGHIYLDGAEITKSSAVKRARLGIRRTFQRQQLFGWLSVEDNLLVPLEWHSGGGGVVGDLLALRSRRRYERERRARVEELLELFSLGEVRSVPAGMVPIGTARLLELARAFADRPRVVLLDEPTSGLEASETAQVGKILAQVVAETKCAVALVEHDVPFVMVCCADVTVLHLGEVLASGSPEEVRGLPAVRDAYLGELAEVADLVGGEPA